MDVGVSEQAEAAAEAAAAWRDGASIQEVLPTWRGEEGRDPVEVEEWERLWVYL